MRKPIVPQRIENEYGRKLRKVAQVVGMIIEHHTTITKNSAGEFEKVLIEAGIDKALRDYSITLTPWAKSIAETMLSSVNNSNKKYLINLSDTLAKQIKKDQSETAIGAVAKRITDEQVHLIKSLPIEAGERVQELARKSMSEGWRASHLAEMIQKSGEVTKSRANTIARTEIHKAWSAFTQSRAQYVGANQYIWRTAGDEIVRDSHAQMEGVVCDFNNPPTLSDGDTGNAGEFPNCRCYSEPIIGEE